LTRVPIRRVSTKSRRTPRQPLNFVAVEEIGAEHFFSEVGKRGRRVSGACLFLLQSVGDGLI
jgi:hypothetical protein